VLDSRARTRVFYDLDTPVTLAQLAAGADIPYLPRIGLGRFDRVLSFTGGRSLLELRDRLGARHVAPLYGSVDPSVHRPAGATPAWLGACSYLGTWAEDRQRALEALFLEPARRRPRLRFTLGGAMYPDTVDVPPNIKRVEHVTPAAHPTFFASCPLTISVTRQPMAALGHCPSGRLFEAAACGVPVLTDAWEGLDEFFTPNEEILIAYSTEQALAAIERDPESLAQIGARARKRVFAEHTAERRAAQLLELLS
jgi:spore maturation protein CgeB